MDDLAKIAVENKAWKEGYVEALEDALTAVESTGRFGLEKVVKELQIKLDQAKEN